MKIHYALLLCCLFVSAAPSTSLGEVTFRPFVTADGRSLNAAVKDYNEHTKKIQIKRADGKLIWVLPTVFSDPDREYIRQWIAVDQFMSPTKFRIKGKKVQDKLLKTTITYDSQVTDNRRKSGYKQTTEEVHKVQILDPAAGTGTFLAEVVKHIGDSNLGGQ